MTSSSRLLALVFVSLAGAVGACSVSADSASPLGNGASVPNGGPDAGSAFTDPGSGGSEAGAAATTKLGSALCNATTSTTCVPDGQDDMTSKCDVVYGGTGGAGAGSSGDDDGGAGVPIDAGAVAPLLACHVTLPDAGAVAAPECLPAGQGKNGASCKTSVECASGFECVGDSMNAGICRQYCCVNACDDNSFCDVQPERANPAVHVPVCEPVQHCGLLASPSDCNGDETCAIVNDDDGTTSCVQIGPAKVGESCDETHCGRNLTCLGAEGARKCVALCDKSKSSCSAAQTCVGSAPLIHDMGIGVCQ